MHYLHQIPLFQELNDAQNILIAGAGGGFDIFAGIPLYFSLKAQGKNVFLANYAFTQLHETSAEQVFPNCYKVKSTSRDYAHFNYFPEKYLAEWFLTQEIIQDIYAFSRTGVKPLKKAYDFLVKQHAIDAIVLIDGGTDSLMFGDEEGLGTPQEDSCSMAAVYQTSVAKKLLVCLGFGVDHFHGVAHYRFLENVATLIKDGGFLGSFHLINTMHEAQKYQQALAYANRRMPKRKSIVSNSIVSALEGEYGNYHRTNRTQGSELWINPLMTIYWGFQLEKVVQRLQYYHLIKNTERYAALAGQLARFRSQLTKVRLSKQLPI